jgi:hypothetical protein
MAPACELQSRSHRRASRTICSDTSRVRVAAAVVAEPLDRESSGRTRSNVWMSSAQDVATISSSRGGVAAFNG